MAKKTFSGADSVPWIVRGTAPHSSLKGKDGETAQFKGFSDANTAARSHTAKTGEFVQAVRS